MLNRNLGTIGAAAVLLANLPAGAGASTLAIERRADVRFSALDGGDALVAGDFTAAARASLVDLGADPAVVDAMLDGAVGEQLLPAPDLNGDDLPDVIGLARISRPEQSQGEVAELMAVTARSGLSGAELWSVDTFGAAGMVVDEGAGLTIVTYETAVAAGLYVTSVAPDGTVRWEKSYRGVAGNVVAGWPLYRGTVAAPGGGIRHLVQLVDFAYLSGGSLEPGRVQAQVLSDADGSVVGTSELMGQGVPWAWPAPDLNGDGAGDVLLTQSFAFGTRGEMVAHSFDGTELWTSSAPFRSNSFVVSVGDATGDGVGDVAVGADAHSVALLSGAGGGIVWEQDGDWPTALGDINEDGLPDVGVRLIETQDYEGFVADHAAYTGSGDVIYHTRYAFPISPGRGYSASTTTYLQPSDVDGDGFGDTFHEFTLTYTDNGEKVFDGGATSGTNGESIWEDTVPDVLGASVQGPGVDFVRFLTNPTTVFIDTFRGDDRALIWRSGLPLGGRYIDGSGLAVDLDGDGFGEVLASVITEGDAGARMLEGWVLDGRDGSARWN